MPEDTTKKLCQEGTEEIDSNDAVCPYCGERFQVECEDYLPDGEEATIECAECGMKYILTQSIEITHTSTPDCRLNGFDHDYRPRDLNDGRTHRFCTRCDKCEPIDA